MKTYFITKRDVVIDDHRQYFNKIGIYGIYNKKNKKFYIGSSKDIGARVRRHKYQLDKNKHSNKHLQNAYNKYGADSFSFLTIFLMGNICELRRVEQVFIDYFKPYKSQIGYNIKDQVCSLDSLPLAIKNMSNSAKGRKMSESTKRKLSIANSGKIVSRETIAKRLNTYALNHKDVIERREKAIKMYLNGVKVDDILSALNLTSDSFIYRTLRKRGIHYDRYHWRKKRCH